MYQHLTLGAAVQQYTKSYELLEATKKLYPMITGSMYYNGAASPGPDPNADYWSFGGFPASSFQTVPKQTVYDQIMGGGVVLVDTASADQVLQGQPTGLTYLIGKDGFIAEAYASPGSDLALLLTAHVAPVEVPASGGGGTSPKKKKKKKDSTTSILVAAVAGVGGILIGGPLVGAAAAAVGYYVTA